MYPSECVSRAESEHKTIHFWYQSFWNEVVSFAANFQFDFTWLVQRIEFTRRPEYLHRVRIQRVHLVVIKFKRHGSVDVSVDGFSVVFVLMRSIREEDARARRSFEDSKEIGDGRMVKKTVWKGGNGMRKGGKRWRKEGVV